MRQASVYAQSAMEPQRCLLKAALKSFQKRLQPKKHYVFVIEVQWTDRKVMTVRRSHEEFFIFQCRLADKFPLDSGQIGGLVPSLPGRKFLGRTNTSAVAKKRVPQLQLYIEELIRLPDYISQCDLVHRFFTPTLADYKLADLQCAMADTNGHSQGTAEAEIVSDGSDGDDEYEDYLSSVTCVCDYEPNMEDEIGPSWEEQLSFSCGEVLYVLSLDCPNGFWQARNTEGEVGYIPCRYVTVDCHEMRTRSNSKLGRRFSISAPRQRTRVLKRTMNSTDCLFTGIARSSACPRFRQRRSLTPESHSMSTTSTVTLQADDDVDSSMSKFHTPPRQYSRGQPLGSTARSQSMMTISTDVDLMTFGSRKLSKQSPKRQFLRSSTQSLVAPRVIVKEPSSSPVFRVPEEDQLSSYWEMSPDSCEVAATGENRHLLRVVKECPLEKSHSQVLRSAIMDVITQLDVAEGQDSEMLLPPKSHSEPGHSKDSGSADVVLREKPLRKTDWRSSHCDSLLMDSQSLDSAYASESGHGSGRLDSPGRYVDGSSSDINNQVFEDEVEVDGNTAVVEGEPYRAMEAYTPRENKGLLVEEGELVVVTAKLDDGWWCGHSCNSGKAGWFPAWLVEKA